MWAGVPACARAHLLGCLGRGSAQSPAALWPGNIRCGNLGGADNPQRLAAHPAKQELLASSLIHCKCASMWFQSGAPAPPVLPPRVRQGPGEATQGRAGSSTVLARACSSLLGSLAPGCIPQPVISWGSQGTSTLPGCERSSQKIPAGDTMSGMVLTSLHPVEGLTSLLCP